MLYSVLFAASLPVAVALLGIYRFNFSNDDIYVQVESGEAVRIDLVSYATVTVGPELVDCIGVGPQKCMIVDGEYFYDDILGFEHQEGYSYRIKIEKVALRPDDAAADRSSIKVNLVEILERTKIGE